MKKNKKVREDIFFVRMRRLTIIAFICSILLTVFAIYQSALPGEQSAISSRTVINAVKGWFDLNDTISLQNVEVNSDSLNKTFYYSGDKIKLPLKFTPENANKDLDYSFTVDGKLFEGCSVDSDGYITYMGAETKAITVTVSSKHTPDVKASTNIIFRGISPDDECVEDIKIQFFDEKNETEYSPKELRVGKKYYVKTIILLKDEFIGKYGTTSKEVFADYIPYTIVNDYNGKEKIYEFDTVNRFITFTRDFEGTFTYKLRKSEKKFFSDIAGNENINPVISVSAKSYPEDNYIPNTVPLLQTSHFSEYKGYSYEILPNNEYIITVPYSEYNVSLIPLDPEDGINIMGELRYADENSKNICNIYSKTIINRKVNRGECNLYWISAFNDDIRMKIKLIFEGYTPNKLSIFGKETVSLWGSASYYADFDKNIYNEKKVNIEMVKGENIATFENGVLTPKKLGKVVLRATSEYYPELNVEMTVKVMMWEDFNGMMRKFIGHFLIFFFLGQGYIVCYFFLIKKRWISLILTPLSLFVVAGFTELIQLRTPGRAGMWIDVFLNFLGGILGILFVFICFAVYIFILKRAMPASFEKLKIDFSNISIKTFFKKKEKELIINNEKTENEKIKDYK